MTTAAQRGEHRWARSAIWTCAVLRVFRTVVDCGGMAAAELELNIRRVHR
jgi:hypothetical protein